MINRLSAILAVLFLATGAFAQVDTAALPDVADGFSINFFVKEPHTINPSALCFDRRGRLYVGAGPQYRAPKADSPTDYIKILIDADDDGVAETIKTFAEGLNSVQSMAWRGDELWVANSPELTVLRDTDGDDVANMTAWIMSLSSEGRPAPRSTATPGKSSATALAVNHDKAQKQVEVTIDGKLFTAYRYGNKGKPILYPVIGPHGIAMTRHFPMKNGVAGEAKDHPHHQSIHYNHPVSGNDFWHNKGGAHIRNDSIDSVTVANGQAVIVSSNSWVNGKGKRILSDTTEIRAGATDGGRYIDYQVTLKSTDGDVKFEDSKEGSMSIRTHPALRLKGSVAKGQAINSEGVTGKAVWGKVAKWVDYWGPVEGKNVGIAIFDHPDNPRHPTTWHARDYGLIAANPFGSKHFKAGKGAMTIKSGESTTFKYRFYFHEGSHQKANIPAKYEQWGSQSAATTPNFAPLFNGKDLSNFKKEGAEKFWRVENGVLIGENDEKLRGHYLWTEKDYGDFTLEFDARWKENTKRGVDTGIELRSRKLQLQLGISGSLRVDMTGSFYVAGKGYPKASQAANAKELLNPEGEWNTFRIQARGETFTCWINGKKASEHNHPGYVKSGPLALQIHGRVDMKCEYRNMRISEK